jgi:hypothetical protein
LHLAFALVVASDVTAINAIERNIFLRNFMNSLHIISLNWLY